ncbi:MAG: hypothetical protein M1826_002874 [Phylliscum demangeonii]|nr:MAG: hypothetical protein M1826_002874 [Phylliscum demangeonii]
MQTRLVLVVVSLAAGPALAHPHLAGRGGDGHPHDSGIFSHWQRAGPDDARSPCPGLNTLANHGLLPHSGRNVTAADLRSAVTQLNQDPATADLLFQTIVSVHEANADGLSFDLDHLIPHNVLEHDASLSRSDAALGNNHVFNQTIFNEYMRSYNVSAESYDGFEGNATATLEAGGLARAARIRTEQARDPAFSLPANFHFNSALETAVLFHVMGWSPTDALEIRLDFVRFFFEHERFPVRLGWRPSQALLSLPLFLQMANTVLQVGGEPPASLPA